MSFADPQTITVNSVAKVCNRVETIAGKSVYMTADGEYKLTISSVESKKRTRRLARVDVRVVAADPISAVNASKTVSVYIVVDEPDFGFDDTALTNIVTGFKTWLDATAIGKLLGSQS